MKKVTTEQIVKAYQVLHDAKLGKLEGKEKIAVVKVSQKLKSVATAYTEFEQDAVKRLRPDGFDSIEQKLSSRSSLTPAESLKLQEFNKQVSECLEEEKKKEHELDIEPLSEKTMEHLMESNDFTIGQLIAIEEIMQ